MTKQQFQIMLTILVLIFPFACGSNEPEGFNKLIRVQTKDGKIIEEADLTIEINDSPSLEAKTDSEGEARIIIDANQIGEPGFLIVEALGYERYTKNVDLTKDGLPNVVLLESDRAGEVTIVDPPESTELIIEPTSEPTIEPGINFLPLTIGNTWRYIRTVNPDKDVWYLQMLYRRNDEGSDPIIGRDIKCKPGSYEETYEIVGQETIFEEVPAWHIELSSEECRGRYVEVKKILWYFDHTNISAASTMVREHITYELSDVVANSYVDPPIQTRDLVPTWYALKSDEDPTRTIIEIVGLGRIVQWLHYKSPLEVTTPAGTFTECVAVVEEVLPGLDDVEEPDPFESGWITISVFCPDVGLVKEIQQDKKQNTTYVLELVDYMVN